MAIPFFKKMIQSFLIILWLNNTGTLTSQQRRHDLCPRGENSLESRENVRRTWRSFLLPSDSLSYVFIAFYNRQKMDESRVIFLGSAGSNFIPRASGLFWQVDDKDQPGKAWPLGLAGKCARHRALHSGVKTRASFRSRSYITNSLELKPPARYASAAGELPSSSKSDLPPLPPE